MGTPQEVWSEVIQKITPQVTSTAINTWFSRTRLNKINNNIAVIGCADTFVREWIEAKHTNLLKNVLTEVCGEHITVTFTVDEKLNIKQKVQKSPLFSSDKTKEELLKKISRCNINPKYTFETFIVGPSNRLAHAAAEAVSSKLGTTYNPLFIYGGVGLGKTHLMQAVGNRILQDDPSKEIYYCASESFLNEMVEAIRAGKTSQFREKYRKLDLLIIDDIQFISKWQETQNELFHTFNELYLANKQIVFASDRPPSEITNLMDRLKSRFEGGMVADIGLPTFEMRVAILKKKCEQNSIHLPEDIILTIAQNVESNIRELEGALNRIYNQKNVTGIIPTPKEVQQILKKDQDAKIKKVTPISVIKEVAKEFNLRSVELKSSTRKSQVAIPRQIAMYIIREDLHYKLEDTAMFLKRSDHTTVINAVKKIESLMASDSTLREKINRIRDKIKLLMI